MMNDLHGKNTIRSCYVTFYDIIYNTVNDVIRLDDDVTQASLWIVLVIVIVISRFIIVFRRKNDELLSLNEENRSSIPSDEFVRRTEIFEKKKLKSYKQLLAEMHHATSKCYDVRYASKCIRLVRDSPYLMNVALEPSGLTPFQLVCYNGHGCLIEYMLAKGANPCLKTQSGENALCLAIYHYIKEGSDENLSCLDLLYNSGCTLDPKSSYFKVILKLATRRCNKRLTEWILSHAKSATQKHRSMSVPSSIENVKNYSEYG